MAGGLSMLEIRFFASIREQLGTDRLQLAWHDGWASVDDVTAALAGRGAGWRATLCAEQVIVAVNRTVADGGQPLRAGDEVAYFPPVTGG
jgi:molybdopterin synthase sulfur carrier subunit